MKNTKHVERNCRLKGNPIFNRIYGNKCPPKVVKKPDCKDAVKTKSQDK